MQAHAFLTELEGWFVLACIKCLAGAGVDLQGHIRSQ